MIIGTAYGNNGDLGLVQIAGGTYAPGEVVFYGYNLEKQRVVASVREALDLAIESGHRRIPTYVGNIDNIVGVVRLSDLASEAIA